ncbi:MAG: hypothetical protein INQ03_09225 [Candidatus Heimdallarchaeota archaeon]|nr:hypothetical protein [Candidatus Heimdallarchaeota archaeon]
MSTTEEETKFIVDGQEYTEDPSIETFIEEAGAGSTKGAISKMKNSLAKADITEPSHLFGMFLTDIENIDGVSAAKAKMLYEHAGRLMRKGNIVMGTEQLDFREQDFRYLPTGSETLNEMLSYSDGQIGWRSRTMIELYGGASVGKTQICLTAACMAMRAEAIGGWNKGVAYIDSEGAFELRRFRRLARYWGVDIETLSDKFLYARALTFDDVEVALDNIAKKIEEKQIGIVILDSIMDPLKSQYPVGGQELSNLQPRQKHLKRVLDKLKTIAEVNNLITIYTNHIRSNIGGYEGPDSAQGGAVLAHASDIRIKLDKPNSKERGNFLPNNVEKGIKMGRAKIVDCGFLAETEGYYLVGPMGIADPQRYDTIALHTKQIQEKGYMCIDALGNDLDPLEDDNINRSEILSRFTELLYGKDVKEPKKGEKNKNKGKK